jgi:pimeloyl-ACP methyl ester carboxylesterase/GNAT superfamily N-acetyltransferase
MIPPVHDGFVEVDSASLYYETTGTGEPLVLLHAGIADSRMWDPQVAHLAARYRVVRYDLRGFGRSPMVPGSFAHHDDLAALLRQLGVDRATLVGSSFGGRVAIDSALAHPKLVRALVLVAPALGGHPMSEELDAFDAEIEQAFLAGDFARAAEVDLRVWVDGPRRAPEQVDAAFRARAGAMARHVYEIAVDGGESRRLDPPAANRLAQLRVPVLVVVGELDQPDMLAIAARIEQQAPDIRVQRMANVAHLPSLEQPEAFNRIVDAFLTGLERPRVELRELTAENWLECVELQLTDDQQGLLDSNAVSIAESRFHPWMLPLAIYAGETMVGFVMYSDERDPRLPRYWVHRLMIDRRQQGRGYGRAAMQEVIRRIAAKPDGDEVWIGYVPQNDVARRFYASLGFEEQGEAPWGGDLIARLRVRSEG